MFRRTLVKFCLPCGGKAEVDNVSDFDPEAEYIEPKDCLAVQARARAERYSELMSQWEEYFLKLHAPPPDEYRWVMASHWLWAATFKEQQPPGYIPEKEWLRMADTVKEAMIRSVSEFQMAELVTSKDRDAPSIQPPGASSAPRGCNKCWKKRVGAGPRRYDKLGFPVPDIPV